MKLRFVDAVRLPHGVGQGTRCPPRWCRLPESNRRPAAYEAAALTNMSEYGMKKAPLPGWAKTLAVFGC